MAGFCLFLFCIFVFVFFFCLMDKIQIHQNKAWGPNTPCFPCLAEIFSAFPGAKPTDMVSRMDSVSGSPKHREPLLYGLFWPLKLYMLWMRWHFNIKYYSVYFVMYFAKVKEMGKFKLWAYAAPQLIIPSHPSLLICHYKSSNISLCGPLTIVLWRAYYAP